uniref:THAP domain-containing protein 1 n=1 Tax=Seriola dumerili TaxID=41447 RepID=A0A3B4VHP6_SERDU
MAQSSWKCHCSVPYCSNNKQSHPYLSFHDFPSDDQLRARWVTAIRRDEGATFKILRGSTYVCSLHFNNDDIYCTPKGFRRIKRGAVPSKFYKYISSVDCKHNVKSFTPIHSDTYT